MSFTKGFTKTAIIGPAIDITNLGIPSIIGYQLGKRDALLTNSPEEKDEPGLAAKLLKGAVIPGYVGYRLGKHYGHKAIKEHDEKKLEKKSAAKEKDDRASRSNYFIPGLAAGLLAHHALKGLRHASQYGRAAVNASKAVKAETASGGKVIDFQAFKDRKSGFAKGFEKKSAAGETLRNLGRAYTSGLKSSGGHTIGDTLRLKGLNHISEAVREHGGIGQFLDKPHGREAFSEALGKATPSIGAAAAYGVGLKKVYDKIKPNNRDPYEGAY